jgi:Trk K+ transport system NAD-binding subunit
MEKFVVIGPGSFGNNVARSLTEKGGEVIVVDNDNARVKDVKNLVSQAITDKMYHRIEG